MEAETPAESIRVRLTAAYFDGRRYDIGEEITLPKNRAYRMVERGMAEFIAPSVEIPTDSTLMPPRLIIEFIETVTVDESVYSPGDFAAALVPSAKQLVSEGRAVIHGDAAEFELQPKD